jgi:hypothetical protein
MVRTYTCTTRVRTLVPWYSRFSDKVVYVYVRTYVHTRVRTRVPWCSCTYYLVPVVRTSCDITLYVRTYVRTYVLYVRTYCTYVRTVRTYVLSVRTYNVMSQLSDWKRAHMCTENHVCFGRIHGSLLREGRTYVQYHGTRVHGYIGLRACTIYVRLGYEPEPASRRDVRARVRTIWYHWYTCTAFILCHNFLH